MMNMRKSYLVDKSFSWESELAVGRRYSFKDADQYIRLSISEEGVISVYYGDYEYPQSLYMFERNDKGTLKANVSEPKLFYASLVHRVLYQFREHPNMPYSRQIMDWVYLDIMRNSGVARPSAYARFFLARLLGKGQCLIRLQEGFENVRRAVGRLYSF